LWFVTSIHQFRIGPDALTFTELDAVSTQHPIFVFNASGHLAYANSKAFEVAGIPADVENPPGAEFVRDEEGKLTGIMKNNVAFLQVLSKYPALTEANPTEALVGLLDKWTKFGLTTLSELALGGLSQSPADISVMQKLHNREGSRHVFVPTRFIRLARRGLG
jgi:predicted amidohydrolase YtcJ